MIQPILREWSMIMDKSLENALKKNGMGAAVGSVGGALTKHAVTNGNLGMKAGSAFGATLATTGSIGAALGAGSTC
jgi:hypothetical protein